MARRTTPHLPGAEKLSPQTDFRQSDFDKTVDGIATERMTITQDGQTKTLSAIELVLKRQLQSANAGSPHAQRQFLENARRAEESRNRARDEYLATWASIKEHRARQYASYRAVHGVDPEIYPHPDDIVLDPVAGVHIIGPLTAEDNQIMHRAVMLREACLLQYALDHKRSGTVGIPKHRPFDLNCCAIILNETLPPRLRQSTDERIHVLMTLTRKPKRVLLKQACQAWQRAGLDVPRGAFGPPPDVIRSILTLAAKGTEIARNTEASSRDKQAAFEQVIDRMFG